MFQSKQILSYLALVFSWTTVVPEILRQCMFRGDLTTDQKSASAEAGCAVGVSSTVSASMRSGQSLDVRSHHPHSPALGTRIGGVSETTRLSKVKSPSLKSSSIADAGMAFSLPSL